MAEQLAILFEAGSYTNVHEGVLLKLEWQFGPIEAMPAQRKQVKTVLGARLTMSRRQVVLHLQRGQTLVRGGAEVEFLRHHHRELAQRTTIRLTVTPLEEETVLRNVATNAILLSHQQFEDEVAAAVDELLATKP